MDKKILKAPFPEKIRFGEKIKTKFYSSKNNIKITTIDYPTGDYKKRCYDMVSSTWDDTVRKNKKVSDKTLLETFHEILTFKALPNSLEHLNFLFLIEGLTHIEISHILRHRLFNSIHAQCSGDRFLTNDSVFIPSSIDNSKFSKKYKALSTKSKELYQEMVDSKEISLMDARYILTRNTRHFYYIGMNLKEAISFINQRKCTMVQPELDNILAINIYKEIIKAIPEVKEAISLDCSKSCHYINSSPKRNTRLYNLDSTHKKIISKESKIFNSVYSKERKDLGINYGKK